jgi:hypothetical protein
VARSAIGYAIYIARSRARSIYPYIALHVYIYIAVYVAIVRDRSLIKIYINMYVQVARKGRTLPGQSMQLIAFVPKRTPLVDILRSRTTLFASFSGKRRILLNQLVVLPRVG